MKIVPVTVVQACSVAIIDDLVCLVPAFDQWVNIECVDMSTYRAKTCSYQVYAGSLVFTDPVKKSVYMMDQELSPQSLYRFNPLNGCLIYIRENPVFGMYNFGSHIWYSYDGSRIFLDTGMTLMASSDPTTDMHVHGDFNSSYSKYQYKWFSQSPDGTHLIAGLRSDTNGTVFYYKWPLLQPGSSKPIPLPEKATTVANGEQVHACGKNSLLVFSTYEMSGGVKETGVAHMTI